jgi:hypothetical protein
VIRRLRAVLRTLDLIYVEWRLERHVVGLCWAFGGMVWPRAVEGPAYIQVRVCLKPRWHTDSHAYDIVDPARSLESQVTRASHAWERS